jgi:hypothetical protein
MFTNNLWGFYPNFTAAGIQWIVREDSGGFVKRYESFGRLGCLSCRRSRC